MKGLLNGEVETKKDRELCSSACQRPRARPTSNIKRNAPSETPYANQSHFPQARLELAARAKAHDCPVQMGTGASAQSQNWRQHWRQPIGLSEREKPPGTRSRSRAATQRACSAAAYALHREIRQIRVGHARGAPRPRRPSGKMMFEEQEQAIRRRPVWVWTALRWGW